MWDKMEATSEITGGTLRKLYGGTLRLSSEFSNEHDRRTPTDPPRQAQARRRAPQLREGAGGCPGGLRSRAVRRHRSRRSPAEPGVGIGTLYRHFPNRQALLEALYVGEVEEAVAGRQPSSTGSDPWEALSRWFERFIAYLATKRALAEELMNYMDKDAPLFKACRASMFAAGEPLLKRAQEAGAVRPDVEFARDPPDGDGDRQDPNHRPRPDRAHAPDRPGRVALPPAGLTPGPGAAAARPTSHAPALAHHAPDSAYTLLDGSPAQHGSVSD